MNGTQELDLILKLFDTLATAGVLLWIVWQFHKGEIVSKSVVDRLLLMYEAQARETFNDIMDQLERIVIVCPLGFSSKEIREAVQDALEREEVEE